MSSPNFTISSSSSSGNSSSKRNEKRNSIITGAHRSLELNSPPNFLESNEPSNAVWIHGSKKNIPELKESYLIFTVGLTLSDRISEKTTLEINKDQNVKKALEILKSSFPSTDLSNFTLFIPCGIYTIYPNGKWLSQDDKLNDFYKQGVSWLELKPVKFVLKFIFPDLRTFKSVMIEPFSSVKDTFSQILEKMTFQTIYNLESYSLYVTPNKHKKEDFYGVWLLPTTVLAHVDLINRGVLHFMKQEWQITILTENYESKNSREEDPNTYFNLMEMKRTKLVVNPFSTVEKIIQEILQKLQYSKSNPRDYLLLIRTQEEGLFNQNFRPDQEEYYYYGHILKSNEKLYHYYNIYDGLRNDIFELRKRMRHINVHQADGNILKAFLVDETQTAGQILKLVCEQIGISKKEYFGLKVKQKNGLGKLAKENMTLLEQSIFPEEHLELVNKQVFSKSQIAPDEEVDIHLTYFQVKKLVREKLTLPSRVHILLASLQLKSEFPSFKPNEPKPGFIINNKHLFPAEAINLESEILAHFKRRPSGETSYEAKLKYVKTLQSSSVLEDVIMKASRIKFERYEINAKGLGLLAKKASLALLVDIEKKSITLYDCEEKKNLQVWQQEELKGERFKIEKSLEDPLTLSILNYKDKGEKNLDITFGSNAEREAFYYSILQIQAIPEVSKLKIYTGTWNLGSSQPPQLNPWIPTDIPYDIYAVAVQECKWQKGQKDEEDWSKFLRSHIGNDYFILAETNMWEIGLVILAHKKHEKYLTNIQTASKPTGFANIVRNKGAVGISFCYHDTSFCFISSHLPARAERVLNRNQDYSDVVEGLDLGVKKSDLLNQFHHIFWLGDLNYRLDLSRDLILYHMQFHNWEALLPNDQLIKEMNGLRSFFKFKEGKISFKPTYRWERGTDELSKKKLHNVPSYCDRILWRSFASYEKHVKQLNYESPSSIQTSDHRPVYSTFDVDIVLHYEKIENIQLLIGQFTFYSLCLSADYPSNFPLKQLPSIDSSVTLYAHSSFFDEGAERKISLQKTLESSVWRSSFDIASIGPFQTFKSYLQRQHILFQVIIGDVISGYAVLPLYDFVKFNKKIPFCIEITFRGLVWGYLTGTLDKLWTRQLRTLE